MTYSWQNEDGEPIMSGEAWRFEQQLDMDSQADYYADRFYDDNGYPECTDDPDDPMHDGWSWNDDGEATCDYCDLRLPQRDKN